MGRWTRGGEERWLQAREQAGRDPSCSLVLTSRRASAVHAVIAWVRGAWTVRDLASTNGTFINGQRIAPGRDRVVEPGDRVAFGDPEDRWEVASVDEPVAQAVSGDRVRRAVDGVLALPDDDHPELVLIEQGDGGWCLGDQPVHHGQELSTAGARWQLRLPTTVDSTGGLTSGGWSLSAVHVTFTVSADEEHVELQVAHAGDVLRLPARSHNYLLLLLARARLEDRAEGASPHEEGWRTVEQLCRALRVSEPQLNLHIHRARRQVPKLMVAGQGGIIERRLGSGQLRLAPWVIEGAKEVPGDRSETS